MSRKILHLDLDAFFCAVEEQHDPSLRRKPFAVGGRPQARGVVSSCSYAARQFGVRSAMPMAKAFRLCPQLIIVPPRHDVYYQVSRQVMEILHNWTPLVEQVSVDEAFLDLSDLPDSPEALARRLQGNINKQLGLPCSIGAATNKLVAKIATEVGKGAVHTGDYPNAIQVVPPGEEAAFLAPLPTEMLWGVGPKTAARLAELGIKTIGEIARWPEADLVRRFGQNGELLARRARGIDNRPVVTEHAAKSISQEITFARDVRDGESLRQTLRGLTKEVGYRLRRAELSGATVRLKLRWPDFTTITRQATLPQPTDQDGEIYAAALQLFDKVWPVGRPVRLIGVGVSELQPTCRQLSLWDTDAERERRLLTTLDTLRERFGDRAVQRGRK